MADIRTVRNFWVNANVESDRNDREVSFGTGRGKDCGMDLTFKVRNDGAVFDAVEIIGRAYDDGRLTVTVKVYNPGNHSYETYRIETKR